MATRNWAVLRKFLRTSEGGHNREVYRHFKDVADTEDTNRKKLRDYCLIQANDSITDAKLKILIFDRYAQKSHLKPIIHGMPKTNLDETVEYLPQIYLYFNQDSQAVPSGGAAIDAYNHIRIINETRETITPAKAEALARKIANQFVVNGTGFTFTKGKYLLYYRDKTINVETRVYAISEIEGTQVIKKLLELQDMVFDSDKLTISAPKKDSITNPTGTTRIYNKTVSKQRYRPIANVRFRYATLLLHGYGRDINLVDTTGRKYDALVRRF